MHAVMLAAMKADGRFAETIDKYGEGLTGFLSEAIRANAQGKA